MEGIMKRVQGIAIAPAMAFCLMMIGAAESLAYAGPNVPRGHYCLSHDTGGADCGFTTDAQCLATASGIDGECYGKTVRDDDNDRDAIQNGHRGFRRPAR
jgi:Protein of unknown function (DUF3551)